MSTLIRSPVGEKARWKSLKLHSFDQINKTEPVLYHRCNDRNQNHSHRLIKECGTDDTHHIHFYCIRNASAKTRLIMADDDKLT